MSPRVWKVLKTMIYHSDNMTYLRFIINLAIVILTLARKVLIRRKRKIIMFDAYTGISTYKTTYYVLIFIPVWSIKKTTPKYAVQQ